MEITTIAVEKNVKEKIKEFGNKGETFSQIVERLLESANNRILQDLLMDTKNTVPIGVALARAKKRWQK